MTNLPVRLATALLAILLYVVTVASFTTRAVAANAPPPFLPDIIVSSTVPPKGDLNPYGVAIVPAGFPSGGKIMPGDVLVSNFNNKTNTQVTGTTYAPPPRSAQGSAPRDWA
jgi:hypothetical protein